VVGLIIRLKLDETPEFQAEAEADEVSRAPLGILFRDHWADVLRVFFAAFIAMVNTMFQVFALNFATSDDYEVGFSSTFMLWLAIIANIVAICTIPFWARLSDRVGRKPVFLTGVIGSGVLVTLFLGAISSGNEVLTFVLGVLLAGVVYSMPNAVWPATYAEYFPTRVRLSGMAIGTQFGFALAGFTPTIASALMGGETDNWYRVALFASAACVISAIAVLSGPGNTHRVPTREIGEKRHTTPRASVLSQA
jgi:MFS family permease